MSPIKDKYNKNMNREEIQKNLKSGDLRDAAEMPGISYESI